MNKKKFNNIILIDINLMNYLRYVFSKYAE